MKTFTYAKILLAVILISPGLAQAELLGDLAPTQTSSSCAVLRNDMQYRSTDISTNGEVSALQDFLQSKGYLNSEPTGYFGLLTQAAVKSYQAASGILNSGYVGPITRGKIQAASCGAASNPPGQNLPDGCQSGSLFSSTTGEKCVPLVACTMEAKMCPDGSYVGRQAPTCAFAACPTTNSAPSLTVTTPNGGEQYAQGTKITVNWSQNYKAVDLRARVFDVFTGTEYYSGPIGDGTGGIGKNVDVLSAEASNIPTGSSRYRLTICDEGTANPAVTFKNLCDSSDTAFSIISGDDTSSPASINVLYPTAGMQFTAGQPMRISWQAVVSANARYAVSVMNGTVNFLVGTFLPAEAHCSTSDKCYVNWTPSATWFSSTPVAVSVYDTVSRSSGKSASFMLNGPSSPSCRLTTNKSSYQLGEEVTFSWTSKNATYATFKQYDDGKDHQYVAGDKLDVSGTYSTPTNVYGNPTVTLLIYNYSAISSCSTTFSVQ